MKKNNLELFKQALSEGLSNRIDQELEACTAKVSPSLKHRLAMRAILRGKAYNTKPLSPRARKVIAILVAAALLLTSCAVIYRDEIRGFIEEVSEHFTKLSHSDETNDGEMIEEIYEFTYLPEGYVLERTMSNPLLNKAIYCNSNGDRIIIEQSELSNSRFFVDNEDCVLILSVDTYDVYHVLSGDFYTYLWNDGKYAILISSDVALPNKELISIVKGVKIP